MLLRGYFFRRMFTTTSINLSVVQKGLLSQLRNKTGLPFTHCKKALEIHQNDLQQSEIWLREQAQKEGWAKVAKLQSRSALQGLVGILVDRNFGVMIEVNCESDFVAKNAKFIGLVENLARNCYQHFHATGLDDQDFKMWSLNKPVLDQLPWLENESKTLSDLIAMNVGLLGENMMLRRAIFCKVADNCILSNYAHASGVTMTPISGFIAGQYGALVAFKAISNDDPEYHLRIDEIGTKLCQHVVGMNPKSVGNLDDKTNLVKEDETKLVKEDEIKRVKEDETRMIFQEFVADPDLSVGDFLQKCNVTILNFCRYHCGEALEEKTNSSI